ncbi:FG-GAP repeat protein [Streptomyces sp. NPDC006430]|uniref:FG-GAP and VCBS repeat-containing protein n=1 Tax=Streptomyces sp. NPDC006430 TaxID=3154299 RepID=UPI0033B15D78
MSCSPAVSRPTAPPSALARCREELPGLPAVGRVRRPPRGLLGRLHPSQPHHGRQRRAQDGRPHGRPAHRPGGRLQRRRPRRLGHDVRPRQLQHGHPHLLAKADGTFNASFGSWRSGNGNGCWNESKHVTGDFNGDGRDDIAITYNYYAGGSAVFTFKGAPTAPTAGSNPR